MKKSLISRIFPFVNWLPQLKDKNILKADIIAGATVALVLIPQSMAYAQLAGLAPYYGLYASFLPVIIAALWGSSRQLATGPVAVVSLITAATLEPLAISSVSGYAIYAAFLALIVGIIQLSLGLLRMGKLVDFLSHPVIIGFTNAAAIVIGASQLNKIFGIQFGQELTEGGVLEKAEYKYNEIWNILSASINNTDYITLGIGMSSIVLLFGLKKFLPKIPGVLIGVVGFTLFSYFIGYESMGGLVIGNVPAKIPGFSIPFLNDLFDWKVAKTLLMASVTIAIIGFAESISVAKAMASESKKAISANRELIGQGLGNITSSAFSGYPVGGSFSRSAINFSAGAQTGFSSIVTGLLVAITLLFLTPLLHHLPQATLAAIIIVAVASLVKIQPIIDAWKIEKHDGIIAIVVFIVTLVSAPHLEKGLIVGVGLSLALFIYRSMTPNFAEVAMYKDKELRNIKNRNLKGSKNVGIYQFEGPLYFASSGYFEGKLMQFVEQKPKIKLIILDFGGVDEIDSSGLEALENIIENFEKGGVKVLLSRIRTRVYVALIRSGFTGRFGEENIFRRSRHEALEYAKNDLNMKINIEPYYTYTPRKKTHSEHLSIYQKLIKRIIRDRGDI